MIADQEINIKELEEGLAELETKLEELRVLSGELMRENDYLKELSSTVRESILNVNRRIGKALRDRGFKADIVGDLEELARQGRLVMTVVDKGDKKTWYLVSIDGREMIQYSIRTTTEVWVSENHDYMEVNGV